MPELYIQDKAKKAAGRAAAELVQNGMLIGIGTGSTVAFFIERLGERCKEGLVVQAVSTSRKSTELAVKWGIPLLDHSVERVDLAIDGADEIDETKQMIKGGGGALLREKIVAAMADQLIIIIDEKKYVKNLGAFPLPLEISGFCYTATLKHLENEGFNPTLRKTSADEFIITDNGNPIVDLHFDSPIQSLEKLDNQLHSIPGVLATGLFLNFSPKVLIGLPNEIIIK